MQRNIFEVFPTFDELFGDLQTDNEIFGNIPTGDELMEIILANNSK